jgi:hypothetical protein
MKCHTNDNSTSSTQLPHKFSYIVAILGHNNFESPNIFFYLQTSKTDNNALDIDAIYNLKLRKT